MLQERLKLFFRYYSFPLLSLMVILAVTVYMTLETKRRADERGEDVFQLRSALATQALAHRVNHYVQILRGGQGLFIASDTVGRLEWKKYVQTLRVEENYPGIQGVGFAVYVPEEDLEEHVAHMRETEFDDYQVFPDNERGEYTSIIYLEPMDWRNRRAIGFDMFSEPVRQLAMQRARDTGMPSLTAKVTLVQETTEDVQPGFLIYLPVYDDFCDLSTVDDRKRCLKGYVYSPFRASDMMVVVFRDFNRLFHVEVFDGDTLSPERLLFSSVDRFITSDDFVFQRVVALDVPGREWSIRYTAVRHPLGPNEYDLVYTVVIGGTVISFLIFFLMYYMAKARKSQDEINQQIKDNAEMLEKIFSEVPALVAFIDVPQMEYKLVNPKFDALFSGEVFAGASLPDAHKQLPIPGFLNVVEEVRRTGKTYIGKESQIFKNAHDEHGNIKGYYNIVVQPIIDSRQVMEAILIFAVDVTEIVAGRKELALINEELLEKNKQLLKINNDLDNFVYTASHDLKAPISNIEGLVHVLREGEHLDKDEVRHLIDMILVSVERFKNTIIDLTEITKAQKNEQDEVDTVDLYKILEEVQAYIQDLINITNAKIHIDLQVPEIRFSKKNLRSILYNLLSNAIKYRSPDRVPSVEIASRREGAYIVLSVKDNGLGIDLKQKEKMFNMFSRLHDHVEGTGVGLYIVKRIMDNTGGKIEVESEPGKGTTFYLYVKQ